MVGGRHYGAGTGEMSFFVCWRFAGQEGEGLEEWKVGNGMGEGVLAAGGVVRWWETLPG